MPNLVMPTRLLEPVVNAVIGVALAGCVVVSFYTELDENETYCYVVV